MCKINSLEASTHPSPGQGLDCRCKKGLEDRSGARRLDGLAVAGSGLWGAGLCGGGSSWGAQRGQQRLRCWGFCVPISRPVPGSGWVTERGVLGGGPSSPLCGRCGEAPLLGPCWGHVRLRPWWDLPGYVDLGSVSCPPQRASEAAGAGGMALLPG